MRIILTVDFDDGAEESSTWSEESGSIFRS